jgi:hypothetical protein
MKIIIVDGPFQDKIYYFFLTISSQVLGPFQYHINIAPREPKLHSMLKANSQHLSLLFIIDLGKTHLQIFNRADINVVLEWA